MTVAEKIVRRLAASSPAVCVDGPVDYECGLCTRSCFGAAEKLMHAADCLYALACDYVEGVDRREERRAACWIDDMRDLRDRLNYRARSGTGFGHHSTLAVQVLALVALVWAAAGIES